MCGSKYDWGRFNKDTEEWEFPRYVVDGNPVQIWNNERSAMWLCRPRLCHVLMYSARIWARTLAVRAMRPAMHAAFVAGFEEELRKPFSWYTHAQWKDDGYSALQAALIEIPESG